MADDDRIGTVACGRAAPTASTASPPASSPAGIRLHQRLRLGTAARTSAIELTRTATRLRRCRVHHQIANTNGMMSSASSAHGQENDTQITRPDRRMVSTAPTASSTSASPMNAPASGTC